MKLDDRNEESVLPEVTPTAGDVPPGVDRRTFIMRSAVVGSASSMTGGVLCAEERSLIVAYSHCIPHGYAMAHGAAQQKRAVDAGVWPLYRFDPARLIAVWLKENDWASLDSMRGNMLFDRIPDPAAYERARFREMTK